MALSLVSVQVFDSKEICFIPTMLRPAWNLRAHPSDEDHLEPASRAMQAWNAFCENIFPLMPIKFQNSSHEMLETMRLTKKTLKTQQLLKDMIQCELCYCPFMHFLVFKFHLVTSLYVPDPQNWWPLDLVTHLPSAPQKARCQRHNGQGGKRIDLGGTVHVVHVDMGGLGSLGSWAWVKKSITRTYDGGFHKWRYPKWMVYNGKSY